MEQTKSYAALRQEVKRDLEHMFPGTVFLTLAQVAKLYNYKDAYKARQALNLPCVGKGHAARYYLGDVINDIARKRCGNV